jgi:hypothetical protein
MEGNKEACMTPAQRKATEINFCLMCLEGMKSSTEYIENVLLKHGIIGGDTTEHDLMWNFSRICIEIDLISAEIKRRRKCQKP